MKQELSANPQPPKPDGKPDCAPVSLLGGDKRISIKQRVHDGHLFYWTTEAMKSSSETIGFYFDGLGVPQQIKRKSLYGTHIILWECDEAA